MTNQKVKTYLDFIPLAILTISALLLIWHRVNGEILFQWKHIIGLILLPVNYFSFWKLHKLGVIGLGLTLLIGLFGLLSFSPVISISELYWIPFDVKIPIFYGQPIFLLWFVIHFIISGRHYFAILTRKYWQDLLLQISQVPELKD